jgi:hypothetical protein
MKGYHTRTIKSNSGVTVILHDCDSAIIEMKDYSTKTLIRFNLHFWEIESLRNELNNAGFAIKNNVANRLNDLHRMFPKKSEPF